MSARHVVLAGLSERSAAQAGVALAAAGYRVTAIDTEQPLVAMRFGDVGPPELVIVDEAFGNEGGVALCHVLRGEPGWRTVSLMLVLPAGEQRIEECLVSGINDFILDPFPDAELLEKAARLTDVPARRDVNTLARLRDPRFLDRTMLGKTINVSMNGVLVEIEASLPVARRVELEFFLPEDAEPVRATGRVIRRAHELDLYHPAFGIRFEEMSDADHDRIDGFVARRERAVMPPRETT